MRIAICGGSGSGKTTLAKYISEKFDIPYVFTDGEALRAKYGYSSHKAIIADAGIDPQRALNYQMDLLNERIAKLTASDNLVMDRSLVDNATYFLLQLSPHISGDRTLQFISKCVLSQPKITHQIFIPPCYSGLPEDDGVRIQNRDYQDLSYHTAEFVATKYFGFNLVNTVQPTHPYCKVLILDKWDLDWRKEVVGKFLL